MEFKRGLWGVGLLLAAWGVYHLMLYEYRYEALGTNHPASARKAIIAVERSTGTACVWATQGWICVDAATFERAEKEGWAALPPLRGEPMPHRSVGAR
jgi:hypothetical protein